jgi:hypothetical protein
MAITMGQTVIQAGIIGCMLGVIGIVCKIVWDWLKNRRPDTTKPVNDLGTCGIHGEFGARISHCEDNIQGIKEGQAALTATVTERTIAIEKELQRGNTKFGEMTSNINAMNVTLAGIAAVVNGKKK